MSTAATNQTSPSTELPLAAVPAMEVIPPAVQAELTALRSELAITNSRLAWLENSLPLSIMSRSLVPLDSPEMQYALELSQEVFPGCRVAPDVMVDPDDPSRTWYSLNIQWKGELEEMLARDLEWHRLFEARFPDAANDFCLNSLPE